MFVKLIFNGVKLIFIKFFIYLGFIFGSGWFCGINIVFIAVLGNIFFVIWNWIFGVLFLILIIFLYRGLLCMMVKYNFFFG